MGFCFSHQEACDTSAVQHPPWWSHASELGYQLSFLRWGGSGGATAGRCQEKMVLCLGAHDRDRDAIELHGAEGGLSGWFVLCFQCTANVQLLVSMAMHSSCRGAFLKARLRNCS